jgi:hypothetical protein
MIQVEIRCKAPHREEKTMSANPAPLPNAFAGPELVPFIRDAATSGKESDSPSTSSAESLRRAKALLAAIDFEVTSIDFEVTSALSLCVAWHDRKDGDIYLIRTLQRIAEHMKSLHAAQATLNQPRDVIASSDLHIVNRGN